MKSKSNKHKLEKRKKNTEMSEGERNLPVRRRNATEREAAKRERERESGVLRGRELVRAMRERARVFDER